MDSQYDVIVIGAGISGIAAATYYLEANPTCRLILLERDTCVGGAWNRRRLYDNFWSQIGLGMAEFSDVPMKRPPEESLKNELMEARYVTEYLEQYVEQHVYDKKSLRHRTSLGFVVHSVEKRAGQWIVSGTNKGAKQTLRCNKLLVTTGLTSAPVLPMFRNQDAFNAPILHQSDFGTSGVLAAPKIANVTVLGGAKSAADMVYASVKAGKTVTWLIRSSGSGPAAFVSAEGKGSYKNSAELGAVRWMATLSPSIFGQNTYWTKFLHSTRLGRWLTKAFWEIPRKVSQAMFDSKIEANESFQKLRSDVEPFWANDTLGLVQHQDFWPLIAKHVQIVRGDIDSLSPHTIHLKDGSTIAVDALLCGTGWLKTHDFFSPETARELGLPHALTDADAETEAAWNSLEAHHERRLLARFPVLQHPPKSYPKPAKYTPFRLYNLVVPISDRHDRSIAFVGYLQVPNSFRPAEIQAMWATAYLDGKLDLPFESEMRERVAGMVAFNRKRYLNNGNSGIYMQYDMIGYGDGLLRELGLREVQKGWWRRWLEPCWPRDLMPARQEFMRRYGSQETGGKDVTA